ncbi:metal transporter, putative [Plasmodium ovale curtisi]|uniref:Metal transporter, putative n=1 Tax=Plasmodium ovale curtisi TaxID=864141 RepID=A0A1A8X6J8_PLAOA|nr:metal transporter, putative [Plasmodium ovale curtisi]
MSQTGMDSKAVKGAGCSEDAAVNFQGKISEQSSEKENQSNFYSYRKNAMNSGTGANSNTNVKMSSHNNSYDMKHIKKEIKNLNKISNEKGIISDADSGSGSSCSRGSCGIGGSGGIGGSCGSGGSGHSGKDVGRCDGPDIPDIPDSGSGEGTKLVNIEMSNEQEKTIYIKKLNSTQSTMNIEGNMYNEKDDETIQNIKYKMDNNKIVKSKKKDIKGEDGGMIDSDKESFENSFYMSENLEEDVLSTDGKSMSILKKLKMCFNYFGPGWIVAIAYLDPGNLCSNLNVGLIRSTDENVINNNLVKDYTGYHLLWILAYGHLLGFIFQVLSMKLGHVTGLDLASICYKEFNKKFSYFLYIFVQIAIWGAHVQAIIGTFVAIHLIFGISVKIAILYTLVEALIYSFLENKSLSLLENVLSMLIGLLALCFIVNVFMTPINFKEVALSIIYPRIPQGKGFDAMALLGSIISAHVFYLHTNLTAKKRAVIFNDRMLKRYNTLGTVESAGSLLLSCITNCIIVLTFAEVNINANERRDAYNLFTAYEVMKKSFGKISMYIWSFGLLSSGNNSSFMCEYASKSVFEGFLNKKMNPFFRVLFFRFFLFLIVYMFLLYDKYSIDQLTNFINVIQVLLLPLAICLSPKRTAGSGRYAAVDAQRESNPLWLGSNSLSDRNCVHPVLRSISFFKASYRCSSKVDNTKQICLFVNISNCEKKFFISSISICPNIRETVRE